MACVYVLTVNHNIPVLCLSGDLCGMSFPFLSLHFLSSLYISLNFPQYRKRKEKKDTIFPGIQITRTRTRNRFITKKDSTPTRNLSWWIRCQMAFSRKRNFFRFGFEDTEHFSWAIWVLQLIKYTRSLLWNISASTSTCFSFSNVHWSLENLN